MRISCERESLLTNVTFWPTATATADGLTPADVIVMLAPLCPPAPPSAEITVTPVPDGEEGEEPPHAKVEPSTTRARRRTPGKPKDTHRVIRQKNFREMLKPMYQWSKSKPPLWAS